MNLVDLFTHKAQLDLALALAALPENSPERAALLAKAGLGEQAEAVLLASVQLFARLCEENGCTHCEAGLHCLDDNTLAEYIDGVLHEGGSSVVEKQLAACPVALRRTVAAAQLVQELAPVASWRAVVLGVAQRGLRILSAPFEGFAEQALQPVAVLSSSDVTASTRRWRADDGGVTGDFTVTLEEGGAVGLSMLFEHGGRPLSRGRIGLRLDDTLLEVQPLLADAACSFWHLEPGHYLLEFSVDNALEASFPIVLEGLPQD